ncbi:sugar-binding transcriptional regulator [Corynebacterium sp. ES2730-CONJ]|uniref:sugar-binding transcriptional regulator n=1 Tax=Corynebacterium sp. ES2730-CONJ TaxID=2973941 RepID=UPI00216B285E|nr:sugar-binding transcriptional regulator [Corynebacterium sp. ES2730-CONJ]MCS4532159.1 sugar-binding transcriptional regulator [Corynebacterium sp. ES2730-CONJ]
MNERLDLAHKAAEMYYLNNHTMAAIAQNLGVSRSTVSRLITYARESGIVTISIDSPIKTDMVEALEKTFDIKATCVPLRRSLSPVARLTAVAQVAANKLAHVVEHGDIIGIAWGNTTYEVLRNMAPTPRDDITVVQLNGATSLRRQSYLNADTVLSRAGDVFNAEVVPLPVPAFFDYEATKEAMWRERAVLSVIDLIKNADLAVFGIGAFNATLPSLVYSGDYLEESDITSLTADGIVGDICTVFIREDGSYRDIAVNRRASGPTPDDLKRVKRRLCIVAEPKKAPALLGALRAGVITDLIVDEATARAALERGGTRAR